jgi:hypothetical protein
MTIKNTTRDEVAISEGQEYMITVNGRTVYTGIAESDDEAVERLESYALYISAGNNSSVPLKIRIVPM